MLRGLKSKLNYLLLVYLLKMHKRWNTVAALEILDPIMYLWKTYWIAYKSVYIFHKLCHDGNCYGNFWAIVVQLWAQKLSEILMMDLWKLDGTLQIAHDLLERTQMLLKPVKAQNIFLKMIFLLRSKLRAHMSFSKCQCTQQYQV